MRSIFGREEIAIARICHPSTLIAVAHREIGASLRFDQQVSISGLADDESAPIVNAVLCWLVKRDADTLERLKKIVAGLKP